MVDLRISLLGILCVLVFSLSLGASAVEAQDLVYHLEQE